MEEEVKETQGQEVEQEVTDVAPGPDQDNPVEVQEVDPKEELLHEIDLLNDKVLRLSAEIANIQKRNTKERQDAAKYRSQSLATKLLTVLDNLERALAIPLEGEQGESLKKGLEMVHEGFVNALSEEGIKEIPALGQAFDPNLHQAVQTLPAQEGQETDQVVQVFQKGYQLQERVIRPAMVIVSQ